MGIDHFLTRKEIIEDLRQEHDKPLLEVYDYDNLEEIIKRVEVIADASSLLDRGQPSCSECMREIAEALEEDTPLEQGVSPDLEQNYWTRYTDDGTEHLVTYRCDRHGHVFTYSETEE